MILNHRVGIRWIHGQQPRWYLFTNHHTELVWEIRIQNVVVDNCKWTCVISIRSRLVQMQSVIIDQTPLQQKIQAIMKCTLFINRDLNPILQHYRKLRMCKKKTTIKNSKAKKNLYSVNCNQLTNRGQAVWQKNCRNDIRARLHFLLGVKTDKI